MPSNGHHGDIIQLSDKVKDYKSIKNHPKMTYKRFFLMLCWLTAAINSFAG